VVAECLIKGSKTQLEFALNQFDLNNNFGSGTIANLSLEENVEWPEHWMHEGTPYKFFERRMGIVVSATEGLICPLY